MVSVAIKKNLYDRFNLAVIETFSCLVVTDMSWNDDDDDDEK